MKNIKKIMFFCLIFLFFPFAFFGCNEQTFDSVPWQDSNLSAKEIISNLENSKSYMIENVGLPVKYKTTTTYTFYARIDGSGDKKVIKENRITTLSNGNENNSLAKVEISRIENDDEVYSLTKTYNQGKGLLYTSESVVDESLEKETTLSRTSYGTVENSFLKILSEVVYSVDEKAFSLASQKEFEQVDYYKIVSESLNKDNGLEYLNKKFVQNSNIYSSPNLFEVYDKSMDYVTKFSTEYGLDKSNYLTYFALDYEISQGDNNFQGERKVYLKVHSVTKLESYGQQVELPTLPENLDLYEVNTFVNTAKLDNSYVIYIDGTVNDYNQIITYKNGEDYIAKYDNYLSGTFVGSTYYYIKKVESGYDKYIVDKTNLTCQKKELFNPLFIEFDYSRKYLNKTDNSYRFGVEGDFLIVEVKDGEISGVRYNNSTLWSVVSYGMDRPSDFDFEFDDLQEIVDVQ